MTYAEAYRESLESPETFWGRAAEAIDWDKKWDLVLDRSNPPFYRWFRGGALNTCYNAVDRHVERGRAEQDAIIYDSPVTNSIQKFTFGEVQNRVAKIAGMMVDLGVKKGRHGPNIYADDTRSRHVHACLRAYRRCALSGFRWLCSPRAGDSHR